MCLIAWNWQPGRATPLLLIANRDEFYARPAQAVQWWDQGHILAGKDLQAGGTWLGVTRTGRLAALTNYRDYREYVNGNGNGNNPAMLRPSAPSRGELVTDFLNSELSAPAFLRRLAERAEHYNPFNLLVFDGQQLLGLQSRGAEVIEMQPGIGAVSNADFHSPWPKLAWLRDELGEHVNNGEAGNDEPGNDEAVNDEAVNRDADNEALLALLQNTMIAPDDALPQTGLPLARERELSAAFITSPDYGTRACSVVRIGQTDAEFVERCFDAGGLVATQNHAFSLDPTARLHRAGSSGGFGSGSKGGHGNTR